MLDLEVERPNFIETTALGAAMLAGVGAGIFKDLQDAALMRKATTRFVPRISKSERSERLKGWADALQRVL